MSVLGLDLNATRARAVRGAFDDFPCNVALDSPRAELPLVVHLEGRQPVVSAAALRLCRKQPQHAWQNFLPQLGTDATRRKIDSADALRLLFEQVLEIGQRCNGVVLALPAYLSHGQIELVLTLADQSGLPLLGSVAAPLAAALAAHGEQAWLQSAVVIDVDSHALTVATVTAVDGQAQLLDLRCLPHLGGHVWRERLQNALADRYILDSRWDPRESPLADQSLYDQIDDVLEGAYLGRATKITVQTAQRFQNMLVQTHDPALFCSTLRRQLLAELEQLFLSPWPEGPPSVVLLSAAAARLPGLVAGLHILMPQWTTTSRRQPRQSLSTLEDFGSGLLDDPGDGPHCVVVLSADAAARGAHTLGAWFHRGDLACGHLDTAAPLPLPQPLEAGPPRLHFQGQDYLLGTGSFTLGRQPGVDLCFDGELWPQIAGRHCEIIYDHRTHMLCDRSRGGTLVNDRPATQAVPLRPGDWIRLGPNGPLLRFLGQTG